MDFDEDPNYLDLDDILAQSQTVNCKLLIHIPGLECLSADKSQDIGPGSDILLPFWMARSLYTYSLVDIELPKSYKDAFRQILEVDADIVDLKRACPHYYRFGRALMSLKRERGNNLVAYTEDGQRNKYRREEGETLDDTRSMANSLLYTFQERYAYIHEFSINKHRNNKSKISAFIDRLDRLEMNLFKLGEQHVEDYSRWRSRDIEYVRNQTAIRLMKRRKHDTRVEEIVETVQNDEVRE